MISQKIKNWFYYGFFFLFFAIYSNCSLMEELSSSDEEDGPPTSLSQQTVGDQGEAINSTGRIQQPQLSEEDQNAIRLAVQTTRQNSQKLSTTTRKFATGAMVILSVGSAFMVGAPFGNFSIYLFENGVPPDHNGTCVYHNGTSFNGTSFEFAPFAPHTQYNPVFVPQNTTPTYQDVLEIVGYSMTPVVALGTAAFHSGGGWVVDTGRWIQQKWRKFWWSQPKTQEAEDDDASDDASSEDEVSMPSQEGSEEEADSCCPRIKLCLPKHYCSLSYWVYSPSTKIINGLYWSWYYSNFIATTFIENYRRIGDLTRGIAWASIFTPLSIPFFYHVTTHLTGEANKHPLHNRLSNNQCRARILGMATQKIVESSKKLSLAMVKLAKITNDDNIIIEPHELEEVWRNAVIELEQDFIKEIENDEQTRSQYSKYISFALQGASFPSKVYGLYALLNKPLTLICLMALGASPTAENIAFYSALIPTLLLTPSLALGSLRELSLVQYVVYKSLGLLSYIRYQLPECRLPSRYQLKNAIAWGLAGGSNIIYMVAPTWFSYERDLMCNQFSGQFRILNPEARGVMPGLHCCGTAGFAGWYFFDRQFERIFDAVMASRCCSSPTSTSLDTLSGEEKKEFRRKLQELIHSLTIDRQYLSQGKPGEMTNLMS